MFLQINFFVVLYYLAAPSTSKLNQADIFDVGYDDDCFLNSIYSWSSHDQLLGMGIKVEVIIPTYWDFAIIPWLWSTLGLD